MSIVLGGLFLSVVSVTASAEEAPKAAGIPLGPMVAYPSLDVSLKHDDNITQANVAKTSSTTTVLAPAIKVEAKSGGNFFGLSYRLEDARYSGSSSDNYTDQFVGAYANFALGVRGDLKLHADYTEQHDARGSVVGQIGLRPEEYKTSGLGALFAWGASGAEGRLEIEGGYVDKEYTTNFSGIQQYANRENQDIGATFFWRAMPKTQLLLQAKHTNIDYDRTAPLTATQDSKEDRYYIGVTWEATAQTTGTVKLGTLRKSFDARPSYSTGSWDAGVTWSPLSYSHIRLESNRQTNEIAASAGDTVRVTNYGVNWTHNWDSRLASTLRMNRLDEDYIGANAGGRSDRTNSFGVGVSYQMQRWLKLGADYSHANRDSSNNASDYKRNILMFTAGATL